MNPATNRSVLTARLVCLFLWVGLNAAHAQRLYRYQDADGAWVYSDRQPDAGQEYKEEPLRPSSEAPEVRVS